MRRAIARAAIIAGAMSVMVACQQIPVAEQTARPAYLEDPGAAGFSPEGVHAIQAWMNAAVEAGQIPSGIAMIARDGEIAWLGTTGEMGPGVPMRRDAIVPLASIGKMYTATAAMILYDRGVIALDEPVAKYIPEFADAKVQTVDDLGEAKLLAPDRPVTIFDLLTHTGGLKVTGNDFWEVWNRHADRTTTTELARDLIKLPLQSQPGEKFNYGFTGASYEVLAAVIEIASGQTLEAFMQREIFEPLGLHDTYFFLPEEKTNRLPAFYRTGDDGLTLDRPYGQEFPRSTYFFGGGGVEASPEDILKFASLFLGGGASGGARILKPETVRLMMSDQVGERATFQDPSLGWGFGASVRMADRLTDHARLMHYGWIGGDYAILWVDPTERLVGYFAFPISPPGDAALLLQYQKMVYDAMTRSYATQ